MYYHNLGLQIDYIKYTNTTTCWHAWKSRMESAGDMWQWNIMMHQDDHMLVGN
jgi:hypothetical protein